MSLRKMSVGLGFRPRGYDSVFSPGSNRSRGSVILFKNSISLQNHWVDSEGRLVLSEFDIGDLSFRVCCVYASNQVRARNEFFEFVVISLIPVSPR